MTKKSKKQPPSQILDGIRFSMRTNGYFAMTSGNRMLMHRYVWQKEHGPIPKDHDIHHRDGNKANNNIENLECLSKAEHTRLYSEFKNKYGSPKVVFMFDMQGNFLQSFPRASFAAKHLNCSARAIQHACTGRMPTCKGYRFSYSATL